MTAAERLLVRLAAYRQLHQTAPTQAELGRLLGVGRPRIHRAVSELIEAGLVEPPAGRAGVLCPTRAGVLRIAELVPAVDARRLS